MSLMVILLGVAGVSINSLVNEQRFKSGVHMIKEKLLLAQQLMLIQKSDIQLKFSKDPKHPNALVVDLYSGKNLSKAALRLLDKTRIISGVAACVFVNSDGGQEKLPFTIDFNATEHKISKGKLYLYNNEEPKDASLNDYLNLTGQLSPFGRAPDQPPFIINTYLYFPKEVIEVWSKEQKKAERE